MKFQDSLLRLPLPQMEETCNRYLAFVEPLITPEAFCATVDAVRKFETGSGVALQAHLSQWVKDNSGTSYIAQMWYDMYLTDRSPLPLNLNPQLTWRDDPRPGAMEQCTRAASLAHAATTFHLTLQAGKLSPDVYHTKPHISQNPAFVRAVAHLVPRAFACYPMYAVGAYPLDMSQYSRLFASTRVPRHGRDELVTAGQKAGSSAKEEVRHIVVQHGSSFYAVDVLDVNGRVVPEGTLAARFRAILEHSVSQVEQGRPPVGALTTTNRDAWAAARTRLEHLNPTNVASLRAIDESLFVLTLDESAPDGHAAVSRTMLHGNGRNRWWDKCLNLVVARNGKSGVSWEHAWGDGAAVLYFFNSIHKRATGRPVGGGNDVAQVEHGAGSPVRHLPWHLDDDVTRAIKAAETRFDTAIAATRLTVYQSEALTKADIKASKLSPDGVMQAVLQLAHWRTHAFAGVTYESASTAAFRHGRTETIRSATNESASMCVVFSGRNGKGQDSDTGRLVPGVSASVQYAADPAARYAALRASSERHKAVSLLAVMGKGVDRHMHALNTWAARLGVPTPSLFTDNAWKHFKDIRLSTSTLASDALDGGGFGPVNGHSYAVGYGVEERGAHFHVMSYKSEDAGSVFPGQEPPTPNPAASGHDLVHHDAYVANVERAMVDVHEAIRKGGPL